MEFKSLAHTNISDIRHVFNWTFADYFVPFQLNEKEFMSKMAADKIDLAFSIGAFENGSLMAFMLHGYENHKGRQMLYNAGTGVLPDKRGHGITTQMYRYGTPIFSMAGIDAIVLEVISTNVPAIKSYRKSGFKTVRDLICYRGKLRPGMFNNQVSIKILDEYPWAIMETFWDFQPTWQNATHVMHRLQTKNVLLAAYVEKHLVGYLLADFRKHRIHQIAVHRAYRKQGIASRLVHELALRLGESFSVINVDGSSVVTNRFFKAVGLEPYLTQLEMAMSNPM